MVGILGWERASNTLVLNQATKREWTIDREEAKREREREREETCRRGLVNGIRKKGLARKVPVPSGRFSNQNKLSFPHAPRANVNLRYYRT